VLSFSLGRTKLLSGGAKLQSGGEREPKEKGGVKRSKSGER